MAELEDNRAFMDRYSRQIGAYGMEAMAKLVKLKVLVVGVTGVGIEAAKNLVLAGPQAVTLHDTKAAEPKDMGSNFFITADDVGKNRAEACAPRLQELNKGVAVAAHTSALSEEFVGTFDCVLFTDGKISDLVRWNSFCRSRERPIAFLLCMTRGAAGVAFSDFGPEFLVRDAHGQNPITRAVTKITNDKDGIVTLLEPEEGGQQHGLPLDSDHDGWVTITEVEGLDDPATGKNISELGPFRAKAVFNTYKDKDGKERKRHDGFRIQVGDLSHLTPYKAGGVITQHKEPYPVRNASLGDRLTQPVADGEFGLLFTDGMKFGRAEQLHLAFRGLWAFEEAEGRSPEVWSEADAEAVLARATQANDEAKAANEAEAGSALAMEELDADVVKTLARTAGVELQPMCTFFGGVIAQEIVKLTGKYTPIHQWVHLDAFEVNPSTPPSAEDRAAGAGTRYEDLCQLYGRAHHETIKGQKTFMVGCGALGCEFLKNFAMLGVGCGEGGLVTTTDNDRIEVSNLTRQFLFREHNVGQPKSKAAAEAVKLMNPEVQVRSLELLVHPGTESTFSDEFWRGQDFITNALDNVKARMYVDDKCVLYGKPLFESGTLGTMCNVQVVLPGKTQSYSDVKDPEDDTGIPMCTLRNFPSLIDHCIEWSRAQFEDLFVAPFKNAKSFVQDPSGFLAAITGPIETQSGGQRASAVFTACETLRGLKKVLGVVTAEKPPTFELMVEMAFAQFHTYFRDRIMDLTRQFPADATNTDGSPFWSGAKRFPEPATFDPENEIHMTFVTSMANILAVNYGLVPTPDSEDGLLPADHPFRSPENIKSICASLAVPEYRPSGEKVKLPSEEDEEEEDKAGGDDENAKLEAEYADLLAHLGGLSVAGATVEVADFEKDEDMNFHIDFISAASNNRAVNYKISTASRHKCKMIAGKIIPAIATTTASVTGLVMLEILKLMQTDKDLEAFKDSSNNLGNNSYFFSTPHDARKITKHFDEGLGEDVIAVPDGFTKWDKTIIRGNPAMTVQGFFDAFKEATGGLEISILNHAIANDKDSGYGSRFIYNFVQKKSKENLTRPMNEVVRELYGGSTALPEGRQYIELEVSCSDEEMQECVVPRLLYYFE